MNPYIIIAAVAVLAASHTAAYHYGGKHRENAIKVEQQKVADAKAKLVAEGAAAVEPLKETDRANTALIDEGVSEYVSTDPARVDCFDDASWLLYNAIRAGTPLPASRPANGQPVTPPG